MISLLTLVVASLSFARTSLIVHQKTGGTTEFAFSENPVVTYRDGYLVISTAETSVLYPLTDMAKFTFSEVTNPVTRITVPTAVAPQPTLIYNISGILLRTLQPNVDGSTPASIDGLPKGTYIIKNGKTSYKISKR